jgi:hypothetical protein
MTGRGLCYRYNICVVILTLILGFIISCGGGGGNSTDPAAGHGATPNEEKWNLSTVGTYTPLQSTDQHVIGDMGTWYINDTNTNDPTFCGPASTSASIIESPSNNKQLMLVSRHGNGMCADNIWASVDFLSIPLTLGTKLSFYETGSLDNPLAGVSYCIYPPCNDSIFLRLYDNYGNILTYVLQYPLNYTSVQRQQYGEIYLPEPFSGIYSRNVYNDFKSISGFNPTGAQITSIEYSITHPGWGIIDDIAFTSNSSIVPPQPCTSNNYYPLHLNSTYNYLITLPTSSIYTQVASVIQSSNNSAIMRFQNSNSTVYSETTYIVSDCAIYYNQTQSFGATTATTSIYPDAIILPADMTPGTTASSTSSYSTGGIVSTVTRTISIIGTESVTVPAGSFQAVKVVLKNTSTSDTGITIITNSTYWYVDGIGRVKIESFNADTPLSITTTVLTSYVL